MKSRSARRKSGSPFGKRFLGGLFARHTDAYNIVAAILISLSMCINIPVIVLTAYNSHGFLSYDGGTSVFRSIGVIESSFSFLGAITSIFLGWLGLVGMLEIGPFHPALRSQWTLLSLISLWFSGGTMTISLSYQGITLPPTFRAQLTFSAVASIIWAVAIAIATAGIPSLKGFPADEVDVSEEESDEDEIENSSELFRRSIVDGIEEEISSEEGNEEKILRQVKEREEEFLEMERRREFERANEEWAIRTEENSNPHWRDDRDVDEEVQHEAQWRR